MTTESNQGLQIARQGDAAPIVGAAENFSGSVRIESRFRADSPARVSGGIVTFEPGARTAWHSHPLGQTLIVTQGPGLVQRWGGPVQAIRQGDVVWIPPNEKHWHGATSSNAMSHVAITEQFEGRTADWLEHVTDAQYRSAI